MLIQYLLTLLQRRLSPRRAVMIFNSTKLSRNRYKKLLEKSGIKLNGNVYITAPFYFCSGNIRIGDGTFINSCCNLLDNDNITIGESCGIGPGVHIYTATHPVNFHDRAETKRITAPVIIENKVWVGGGSIILPGVRIGEGAVIAAGSVVTKNVAPYSVYAGNPAVFKKKIE